MPIQDAFNKLSSYGMPKKNKSQICRILQKTKETVLDFYKGTAKILGV